MKAMLNRMMKGRRRRRGRRAVSRDADALIASFGLASPAEARARAIAGFYRRDGSDAHVWKVVLAVEKRLGIDWSPDTATRYLDNPRGGLNY